MSTAKGKSSYHHGDLREALLQAAESLLEEGDVQNLTPRACARRAGVSHAAPNHHFNDIGELLSEVAARSFNRLTQALDSAMELQEADPDKRFVAVARTYVDFARRHPAQFRLMFRWDTLVRENTTLSFASARTFSAMTNAITLQRGEPDITPETLQERIREEGLQNDVLLGWSHVHGYAQLLLEGQFAGFAAEEGENAFIERTLSDTCSRIAALLRK